MRRGRDALARSTPTSSVRSSRSCGLALARPNPIRDIRGRQDHARGCAGGDAVGERGWPADRELEPKTSEVDQHPGAMSNAAPGGGRMKRGPHHRHHRPGRLVPGGAPAGQGLRGTWHHPPLQLVLDRPDRAPVPGPPREDVRLFLHYADLSDASSLITTLNHVRPDEVYNLGAQSHVRVSFEMPEFTADSTAMGTLRLLEAVRHVDQRSGSTRRVERDVRPGRRGPQSRRPSSSRAARTRSPRCSPTG